MATIDWSSGEGLAKGLAELDLEANNQKPSGKLPFISLTQNHLAASNPGQYLQQQQQAYIDSLNKFTYNENITPDTIQAQAQAKKLIGEQANNLSLEELNRLSGVFKDVDTNLGTKDDISVVGQTPYDDISASLARQYNAFNAEAIVGKDNAELIDAKRKSAENVIKQFGLTDKEAKINPDGTLVVFDSKTRDWKPVNPTFLEGIAAQPLAIISDILLSGGIAAAASRFVPGLGIGATAVSAGNRLRAFNALTSAKSIATLTGASIATDAFGYGLDAKLATGEMPDLNEYLVRGINTGLFTAGAIGAFNVAAFTWRNKNPMKAVSTIAKYTPTGMLAKKGANILKNMYEVRGGIITQKANAQLVENIMQDINKYKWADNIIKSGNLDELYKRYENIGYELPENIFERNALISSLLDDSGLVTNIVSGEKSAISIRAQALTNMSDKIHKAIDLQMETYKRNLQDVSPSKFVSTIISARDHFNGLIDNILNNTNNAATLQLPINTSGINSKLFEPYKILFNDERYRYLLKSLNSKNITPYNAQGLALNTDYDDTFNSLSPSFLNYLTSSSDIGNIRLSVKDALLITTDIRNIIDKIDDTKAYGKGNLANYGKELKRELINLEKSIFNIAGNKHTLKIENIGNYLSIKEIADITQKANTNLSVLNKINREINRNNLKSTGDVDKFLNTIRNIINQKNVSDLPSMNEIMNIIDEAQIPNARETLEFGIIEALLNKYTKPNGFYNLPKVVQNLNLYSEAFTSDSGKMFKTTLQDLAELFRNYDAPYNIKVNTSTKPGSLGKSSIATSIAGRLNQIRISMAMETLGKFLPYQGTVNKAIQKAFAKATANPLNLELRNTLKQELNKATKSGEISEQAVQEINDMMDQYAKDYANSETSNVAKQFDEKINELKQEAETIFLHNNNNQSVTQEEYNQFIDDYLNAQYDDISNKYYNSLYDNTANAEAVAIDVVEEMVDNNATMQEIEQAVIDIAVENAAITRQANLPEVIEDLVDAVNKSTNTQLLLTYDKAQEMINNSVNKLNVNTNDLVAQPKSIKQKPVKSDEVTQPAVYTQDVITAPNNIYSSIFSGEMKYLPTPTPFVDNEVKVVEKEIKRKMRKSTKRAMKDKKYKDTKRNPKLKDKVKESFDETLGIENKERELSRFADEATGGFHSEDYIDYNTNIGSDLIPTGNMKLFGDIEVDNYTLDLDGGLNNTPDIYTQYYNKLKNAQDEDSILDLLANSGLSNETKQALKNTLSGSHNLDSLSNYDDLELFDNIVMSNIPELVNVSNMVEEILPGYINTTSTLSKLKLYNLANARGFDYDVLAADALNPNTPFDKNIGKYFSDDTIVQDIVNQIVELDPNTHMALAKILDISPKFINLVDKTGGPVINAIADLSRKVREDTKPVSNLKKLEQLIKDSPELANKTEVLNGLTNALLYLQGPWSNKLQAISKIYSGQVATPKQYDTPIFAQETDVDNLHYIDNYLQNDSLIFGDTGNTKEVMETAKSKNWFDTDDTSTEYNLKKEIDEPDADITLNSDFDDIINTKGIYVEHDWSIPMMRQKFAATPDDNKLLAELDSAIKGPIVQGKNKQFRDVSKSLISYMNAVRFTSTLSPTESITKLYNIKDYLQNAYSILKVVESKGSDYVKNNVLEALNKADAYIRDLSFENQIVNSKLEGDGTYKADFDLDYTRDPYKEGGERIKTAINKNNQIIYDILNYYKTGKSIRGFTPTKSQILIELNKLRAASKDTPNMLGKLPKRDQSLSNITPDFYIPGESAKLQSVIEDVINGNIDKEILKEFYFIVDKARREGNADLMRKQLEYFEIASANRIENGQEALELLKDGRFDTYKKKFVDNVTPSTEAIDKYLSDVNLPDLSSLSKKISDDFIIDSIPAFETKNAKQDFISQSVEASANNKKITRLKNDIIRNLGRNGDAKVAVEKAKQLQAELSPSDFEAWFNQLEKIEKSILNKNGF